MKRILVPCDFSRTAVNGLQFAMELAAANAGNLIVLSVVKGRDEEGELLASAYFRDRFNAFKAAANCSVQITHEIRVGKLVPVVMETVDQNQIDLVVIGTRGSRGWEGAFMGSNVEKIVRTSPVPVFSVKDGTPMRNIRNIVVPCDFIFSDHFGIAQLKGLQALLHARIHLLRVDTTGLISHDLLLARIEEYARYHGLVKYTAQVVANTDEKDGILRFAREINADMIAMTTHAAGDLNHLYMFSIAVEVVNHSRLLTWTCRQQKMQQPA